jgi:predicted NBD/HSP70 family sugar kinase
MSSTLRPLGPNERLMLHHVRRLDGVAKADLARVTELSTQTASVIINRLLEEQLVRKLDVVRGKIGQPSQPIALNPAGAYAIGVHIGRRSLEVMLLDLAGQPQFRAEVTYAHPEVEAVFAAIGAQIAVIAAQLGPSGASRICGIGVAAPLALGTWHDLLGQPPEPAAQWRDVDIRARLQAMTALPVTFAKDTAAACVAELLAGRGRDVAGFLYVYLDTLAGGSLVVGGQPHGGAHGNAGALGSLPLRPATDKQRALPPQLLSVASLAMLEQRYAEAGLDATAARDARALHAPWRAVTEAWLEPAAEALAYAMCNAACLVDLDAAIVDGKLDRGLLDWLLAQVQVALARYDWAGAASPRVLAGEMGVDANVSGAAYLALHASFAPGPG